MKPRQVPPQALYVITAAAMVLTALPAPRAFAEENAEVKALQQQIETLNKRIEQLESQAQAKPQKLPPASGWDQWSDPFDRMEELQDEMNAAFRNAFAPGGNLQGGIFNGDVVYDQNFDLKETKDGYTLRIDTAMTGQDNLDIEVKGRTLTISGRKEAQEKKDNPAGSMQTQSYAMFSRAVTLPDDADTARMQTKKEGNAVIITLPKKAVGPKV